MFDGQVMRIEFTVARFDDPGALGVLEGRQVPVARLVLNRTAVGDLFNRLAQLSNAIKQAGVAPTNQPAGSRAVHVEELGPAAQDRWRSGVAIADRLRTTSVRHADHRQRAGFTDADKRRRLPCAGGDLSRAGCDAGSMSARGARSTMRMTNGIFSAAAAARRRSALPGHHDLRRAQPQVERVERR